MGPRDTAENFALEAVSPQSINRELLEELVQTRMPFGRFKGRPLIDLPEPYVIWLHQQEPVAGKLGQQLATLYEIKVNGLEVMLRPLLRS